VLLLPVVCGGNELISWLPASQAGCHVVSHCFAYTAAAADAAQPRTAGEAPRTHSAAAAGCNCNRPRSLGLGLGHTRSHPTHHQQQQQQHVHIRHCSWQSLQQQQQQCGEVAGALVA
jgi:hypothetical protein